MELPKEIWTEILKKVRGVKEWGRLQRVCHTFSLIVGDQCWTQAKKLKIQHFERFSLKINTQQFQLPDAKLLLLVEAVAKKATKVQALSVQTSWDIHLNEAIGNMLNQLASAALKIQDLQVWGAGGLDPRLAPLVNSVKGTVKTLDCSISLGPGPAPTPQLLQAFQECQALETIISIETNNPALLGSFLFNKTQLKSMDVNWLDRHNVPPVSVWLMSRAQLTECNFKTCGSFLLFLGYMKTIQEQGLAASHPLATLKTMTFSCFPPGGTIAFHLFPDLEQVDLGSVDPFSLGFLNAMVPQFLSQYQGAFGGRRFLKLFMHKPNPGPSMEEILAEMVCPVTQVEKGEELIFDKGNASAKVIVRETGSDQLSMLLSLL